MYLLPYFAQTSSEYFLNSWKACESCSIFFHSWNFCLTCSLLSSNWLHLLFILQYCNKIALQCMFILNTLPAVFGFAPAPIP